LIVHRSLKSSEAAIANELLSMTSSISRIKPASPRTCLTVESEFDSIVAFDGPRELLETFDRFYDAPIHLSMLQPSVDLLHRSAEAGSELREAIEPGAHFSTAVASGDGRWTTNSQRSKPDREKRCRSNLKERRRMQSQYLRKSLLRMVRMQ
jgi:hypothetical protein